MVEPHLLRDWIAANAAGEILGLGVAVLLAVGLAQTHTLPPGLELLIVTGAFLVIGVYEGALVGTAQWLALRRVLPRVSARSWIGATAIGATVAWILGRLPSALSDWRGGGDGAIVTTSPSMTILLSIVAGAALGAILGAAQWFVLRRHLPRARMWIVANALAWMCAMPVIFLAAALPGEHASLPAIGALVLLAVGLAGAIVGLVEGVFLRRLIPPELAVAR